MGRAGTLGTRAAVVPPTTAEQEGPVVDYKWTRRWEAAAGVALVGAVEAPRVRPSWDLPSILNIPNTLSRRHLAVDYSLHIHRLRIL